MNKRDRDNLNFILFSSSETIAKWMNTLSEEDVDYALWLLKTARTEVLLKQLDRIEDEYLPDFEEDAQKVLKKVMEY